jgi:hypothetical protein
MNKIGYQPLPVLLRAESSDARGNSNSAIILRVVATLGTVVALGGVIVICLIAFKAFPLAKQDSKTPVGDSVLPPATNISTGAEANQDTGVGTVQPVPSQTTRATIAETPPVIDQTSTATVNPPSTSAPLSKPEGSMSDSELLQGTRPETKAQLPERHLPEAVRKNLEKKRRAAERKRSQLEELYRTHAISAEAYKKGEEKYQSAIQKYRDRMNVRVAPTNGVAGQD